MTTAMLIQKARAAGVELKLSPAGRVVASGGPAALTHWTAVLRSNKARLIRYLEESQIWQTLNEIDGAGNWTDPVAVSELMERARRETDVREYFLRCTRALFLQEEN